jgi:lipopolysaccharide export system ATP-binding protein
MKLDARDVVVTVAHTEVVRGVSLSVASGEVLGVLGPSGAGKTTLFRALVGEVPVTSGRIELDGQDVSHQPLWRRARRGMGYVPQTPSVLWDLTVEENLTTFESLARSNGRLGAEAWARTVELEHRMSVRAGELSGGERRRLELARALVAQPSVLVCDEPFAGIDPAGAERLGSLLKQRARAGTAVVLADHHVAEALRVCDRALLLVDGRVEASGEPDAFREHPLVVGRYLGSWTRTVPPPPSPRPAREKEGSRG